MQISILGQRILHEYPISTDAWYHSIPWIICENCLCLFCLVFAWYFWFFIYLFILLFYFLIRSTIFKIFLTFMYLLISTWSNCLNMNDFWKCRGSKRERGVALNIASIWLQWVQKCWWISTMKMHELLVTTFVSVLKKWDCVKNNSVVEIYNLTRDFFWLLWLNSSSVMSETIAYFNDS